MAEVTAAMVKELRETTGAGMMDCKKALVACDGDMTKAIDYLRENGLSKAAKKAGRIAAEGLVRLAFNEDATKAAAVEVNIETDFASKNPEFIEFVEDLAQLSLSDDVKCENCLMKQQYKEEGTVAEALTQKIAKIGENMNIRRFARIETEGAVAEYIHAGGKIGVLVEADAPRCDEVREALINVAMQVAALNPKYLSSDDVPQEYKDHEKEILIAQLKNDPKNANKPDNIIEKMIGGRLAKELKEVCLLEQLYVKAENKESVAQYIDAVSKKVGAPVVLKQFVRFETGEGLEKKEENFADEVASMIK